MSQVNELLTEYKASKKVMVDKISKLLMREVKEMASKIEGLESIRWQQYTPYFNDGEACVFGINDPSFKFKGDEESGDYEDGYQCSWSLNYYYKQKNKDEKHPQYDQMVQIVRLLQEDELEDILKDLYGDHVEITLNVESGNVEVEEYEHD